VLQRNRKPLSGILASCFSKIRGGIDKNLRKIICPKINFEVWKL
jgi:hypothetical protein